MLAKCFDASFKLADLFQGLNTFYIFLITMQRVINASLLRCVFLYYG
jgi:hypothetical protein